MCGICGVNFEDRGLLGRMNDLQRHRGPDSDGTFFAKNVGLGNRRLSIIDTSERGDLPMESADGSMVMVYNGEVYNFQDLRPGLEADGYRFRSKSDAEVVVNAIHRDGIDALKQFNGMFALAAYDKRDRTLLLARDRLGIKPLYYFWDGNTLVFASELKALLERSIPVEIDPTALTQFFTYRFNYGAQTLLRNVYKLDPGHYLRFDTETRRLIASGRWVESTDPSASGHEVYEDEEEAARHLRDLMFDAVEKRLIADVPLGFFLSGGIDSSIITGIAGELGADLKTFSAGFDTTNELGHARVAAEHFGADHTEVHIGDEALESMDSMIFHMDEPIADAAFLATFVLSREASKDVKVVLAGEGADELFAGYDRYKVALYGDRLSRWLPSTVRNGLGRIHPQAENARRILKVLSKHQTPARYLEVIRLFSSNELVQLGLPTVSNGLPGLDGGDVLRAVQHFDVQTLLPNDFFMKADKMSSAWGLEERVPFLDTRVVDFAFRLPARMKLRLGQEKRILRKAFRGLLPESIRTRRKQGFDVPMDHWLRGALYPRLRALLEAESHNLYDRKPLLNMLDRFRDTEGSYKAHFYTAQKLWAALIFELWYRRFVLKSDKP